jgi:diguanylate cyclase (GGDEF)-like protein
MKKNNLTLGGKATPQLNTPLETDHFLRLAGALNDTVLVIDDETGRIVYFNRPDFLGFTLQELVPDPAFMPDHIHPDDLPVYAKCVADLRSGGSGTADIRFKNNAGGWDWLNTRCIFINNPGNKPSLIAFIISVHSTSKRIEILETDRAHALEMIARDWQMEAILSYLVQSISRQIEESCPAILILNDKTLSHTAVSPLLSEAYIQTADVLFQNGAYGLWHSTLAEKKPVLSEDVSRDENWETYQKHLVQEGIGSVFLMPVSSIDGNSVGLIVLYFKRAHPEYERLVDVCDAFANLIQLVFERRHFTDMLYHQAMFDTLTSLPNRNLLEDNMRQILFNARRRKQIVSLVLINLDNFDEIKETLGYGVSEELLRLASDRLVHFIGENNRLARTKEASFAVILENIADRSDAVNLIQQIKALLHPLFRVGNNDLYLETSVGFSIFPRDGEDVAGLIKNAEMALAFPLMEGSEKVNGYEPQMDTIARERLRITTQLRHAAVHDEFVLFYQPEVDLVNRCIIGFEALIRWKHRDYGFVPPINFIPLAEQNGLIVPIGDWVLNEACRQLAEWRSAGRPDVRMSINVSPTQFKRSDFVTHLIETVKKYQIPPDKFAIEIIENIFMGDYLEGIAAKLTQIKSMGIKVHIDDFGTGYSSLSYLRKLPVDCLKIDKFFVDALLDDQGDQVDTSALPRAMITLGHGHKLSVLAEGVETIEQVRILTAMGCDHAQGFYFSRPQPADKIWEAVQLIEETWRKEDAG